MDGKFKSRKRALRRRLESDDEEEDSEVPVQDTIRKMKTIQKLKARVKDTAVIGASTSKEEDEAEREEEVASDFGGLMDTKLFKTKKGRVEEDEKIIGTEFSNETNKRDVDEEMLKYIEDELTKRKKETESELSEGDNILKYRTAGDAALDAVPNHYKRSVNVPEDMLSNQMLNGIPEVDLGVEAKIKNIERTEEAKLKLLKVGKQLSDEPSFFVPTNMAVNFSKTSASLAPAMELVSSTMAKKDAAPGGGKWASDDYHVEKFKKAFRR